MKRTLFAFAASMFAAVAFALPASAYAENVTTFSNADFADGVYTITAPGSYKLSGNATGMIKVEVDHLASVSIDLGDNTLTDSAAAADNGAVWVTSGDVTISNGTVITTNASAFAQGVESKGDNQTFTTLNLEEVKATSTGYPCISAWHSGTRIESGTFTANSSEGRQSAGSTAQAIPVIKAAPKSWVTIKGGDFTLGSNNSTAQIIEKGSYESNANAITLYGGSFSAIPSRAELASGKAVAYKSVGASTTKSYVVQDVADARQGCAGAVLNADRLDVVFFATKDEADACVAALEYEQATACDAHDLKVTFDSNGGSQVETMTVSFYDTPEIPAAPVLDGKGFECWTLEGKEYGFSKPLTDNITLKASWGDSVVAQVGNAKYAALRSAFEYAQDGDTVTLLGNVAEGAVAYEAKNLTVDLGGYTLTGGLRFLYCDGVTVKNGSIENIGGSYYALALQLAACNGFTVTNVKLVCQGEANENSALLDVDESSGSMSGVVSAANCHYAVGFALNSVVDIYDCTFSSQTQRAISVDGRSNVVIHSGEFTGKAKQSEEDDEYENEAAYVSNGSKLEIKGGTFNDYVVVKHTAAVESTVSISGGTFGSWDNADYVTSGYAMLKRAGSSGKCVVMSESSVRAEANWLLTASGETTAKLYFVSEEEVTELYNALIKAGVTATLTAVEHSDYDPYTAADRAAAKKVADQLARVQEDYPQVASDNAQAAGDAAQAALGAYDALTKLQKELVSAQSVSAVQSILDQGRARVAADMITAVLEKYVSVTAANAQDALDAANAAITAYGDLSAEQRELAKQYAGDGNFDVMVDVRDAAQAQVTANSGDKEALAAVQKKIVKVVKLTKKEKKAGKKTLKARAVTVKAKRSASGAKASWAKVSAAKGLKVKGGKVTLKKGAKKGTYTAKLRVSYGAYSKTVKVVFRVK